MGAVYREELSANARKLIEQLLSLPQGWVTAAALAESIGVSRRTVLRELPAVEQWMQAAGAHFVRNPGKGLLLDEAPERRDALRTQLNSSDRKELSRAERRQQLLTRLLSEQEPCKTAVLARALGVSESTLSADLDELETKLHPYRVEMFRRPGVGVWLQGDASSYRRVVSALLLHCRTSAVKDCRLGYLQAQPPVYEPGRIVLGALVLLAPDDGNGVPVEVMQNVSGQLIETPRLMEALRTSVCIRM